MLKSFIKWLLLIILAADLVYLNYRLYRPTSISVTPPSSDCPDSCITKIDQKLTTIPTLIPNIFDTPIPSIIPTNIISSPNIAKKVRTVAYFPVPGDGSTLKNTWENILGTEFYLDTADYPDLKEAYFEANLKLLNGNGFGYVRLFDLTAGVEVWGSDIQSSNQNFTVVVSGKLTLRPGNHLYRVQAKSLTADTTIFNSSRIKLISEN